jgi:Protein of unknown function (DUF4254)
VSVPLLPDAAGILAALRLPPVQDDERSSDGAGGIMDQILALHRSNAAQWGREDDARRDGGNDALVAAAKRDIDRLNRARHRFIEAIDQAILDALAPDDRAPLVTESPGMAIDRLSVLVIRLEATEARAAPGKAGAERYADRLPQLRRQLETLEEAIATLLKDLTIGARRFLASETLKLYGPTDSEPAG